MMLPIAILAGGLATRLGPLTADTPKALVPVAGRPFVLHQLELLQRHGITDVVFCVGHLGEQIEALVGDGSRIGVRAQYSYDGERLLGTAGALRKALPLLGDAFLTVYGDSYLECDYSAIARSFLDSGRAALMTVFRNDDRWDRSNVRYENGRILAYDKAHRSPAMRHIDYGLEAFRPAALDGWPADEPFDLEAGLQSLLSRGDVAAYEVATRFYEVGTSAGLADTAAHLSARLAR